MISFQEQSQGHSAHIGQLVEFHYRWHPFYRRRFRHEGTEERASGAIVRVEISPGDILKVPAWMLDRAMCAEMEMGAPRVSVSGLVELHRLLAQLGFRQTSSDRFDTTEEACNEATPTILEAVNSDLPAEHAPRYSRYTSVAGAEPSGSKRSRRQTGDPVDNSGRRRGGHR
jgi:hypothetical protein